MLQMRGVLFIFIITLSHGQALLKVNKANCESLVSGSASKVYYIWNTCLAAIDGSFDKAQAKAQCQLHMRNGNMLTVMNKNLAKVVNDEMDLNWFWYQIAAFKTVTGSLFENWVWTNEQDSVQVPIPPSYISGVLSPDGMDAPDQDAAILRHDSASYPKITDMTTGAVFGVLCAYRSHRQQFRSDAGKQIGAFEFSVMTGSSELQCGNVCAKHPMCRSFSLDIQSW